MTERVITAWDLIEPGFVGPKGTPSHSGALTRHPPNRFCSGTHGVQLPLDEGYEFWHLNIISLFHCISSLLTHGEITAPNTNGDPETFRARMVRDWTQLAANLSLPPGSPNLKYPKTLRDFERGARRSWNNVWHKLNELNLYGYTRQELLTGLQEAIRIPDLDDPLTIVAGYLLTESSLPGILMYQSHVCAIADEDDFTEWNESFYSRLNDLACTHGIPWPV
jgi:hypothetical protein